MNKLPCQKTSTVMRVVTAIGLFFVAPHAFAIDFIIEGSGFAEVTYKGETSRYPLQIGFGLDTDFSNPKNAIAVFSKTKWEDATNPRRIKLRIDSEQTGRISVDQDNKRFVFIQDGGQIYFPKQPCAMEISRAYSGGSDSHLKGIVHSCVMQSGGLDFPVSARFEVIGTPTYKLESSYDF